MKLFLLAFNCSTIFTTANYGTDSSYAGVPGSALLITPTTPTAAIGGYFLVTLLVPVMVVLVVVRPMLAPRVLVMFLVVVMLALVLLTVLAIVVGNCGHSYLLRCRPPRFTHVHLSFSLLDCDDASFCCYFSMPVYIASFSDILSFVVDEKKKILSTLTVAATLKCLVEWRGFSPSADTKSALITAFSHNLTLTFTRDVALNSLKKKIDIGSV